MDYDAFATSFTGFAAKVRLYDPTYQKDEKTYLVPEWLHWGPVPYFEPNQCCCGHSFKECLLFDHVTHAEHGWAMCRDCAGSWAEDHEVILPNIT